MTDRATQIANNIKSWDKENIDTLKGMIDELRSECDKNELDIQGYVDMTSLPSAEIPEDVDTSYPVWAMDNHGEMLVGAAADDTMPLSEYREENQD